MLCYSILYYFICSTRSPQKPRKPVRLRRSGHVVQISSVQAFFGLPRRTAYSAAKHAALGFYDSLRAEVAESGVAVTTVCPGYMRTEHASRAAGVREDGAKGGRKMEGKSVGTR